MADYQYINDTGLIVADTGDLQAEVEAEYKSVFGQDLVVTPNTPQGVLITAEVTARANVVRNNAALANQINPNLAGGVFLDAIWALTGGQRIAATASVIPSVSLLGLAGTLIPAGSQASLADGTLFESVSDVTLDGGGNGSVDFQAVDTGPISAEINTLTQIVTPVLGWDSVTNPTAATLGRSEESDVASRARRKLTLGLQGDALPVAITSALYDTLNVRSLTFRENVADTTEVIDGVSMVAHSIFVCVDGGTDLDVATTLLAKKSGGCAWNGSTSVDVVEPASGQTYTVLFERPTPVPIQVKVTVRNQSSLIDVESAVRQAVMDYAQGLIAGEPGLVVGASVSPFEIAGAVNQENPGIYVQKCEVSLLSPTSWTTDEIAISITEIATLELGNIIVVVL